MFRTLLISIIAAQFMFMPTVAHAQSLEPDGPWRVDYADNECRLTRSFGTGDGAIGLRIARGASLDNYDVIIAGNKLPYGSAAREVILSATPSNLTTDVTANPYSMKDSKLRIWRWFDIEETFFSGLDDQQTLSFVGRGMNVQLRTPGLQKALVALKTCHDDLLTNVFKLDLAAVRALAKNPIPRGKPTAWVTTDDYPAEALRKNQMGSTQFSLIIGIDGRVTACNILVSSGTPVLDQTVCDLMAQRAHFEPAIDKDGKPATGLWLRTVRWAL